MAIIEIKLARKKLYRGTLNRFLGIDTMFPLVNMIKNYVDIIQTENYITVGCVEGISGQVVNSFSVCEEFIPDIFNVELSELNLGDFKFSLITKFKYNESLFKNLKCDYVVRNQWAFVI